tara:strand:+ start:169625 stop:171913 length:2289 start_codon:yes stop_codon:yes gene_type:complete
MKLWSILLFVAFFLSATLEAAPLRIVPKGNPGLKTTQQLMKLSHEQRVRYFKNLKAAYVEFDKMQTTMRPGLFPAQKKKSKYGFVLSLMNESHAAVSSTGGAGGADISYWHRGLGEFHSNSCIYAGNVSSYSKDPTLGRYGCVRPQGKTQADKQCSQGGGAPCNTSIYGITACATGAARANSTSWCKQQSEGYIAKLDERIKASGGSGSANSQINATKKMLEGFIQGSSTGPSQAQAIDALLKAFPEMKADPELQARLVQYGELLKKSGEELPSTMKYLNEYNLTIEGTMQELQAMRDHCNAPLDPTVIEEAKQNNNRESQRIQSEISAGRHPTVGKVIQSSECNTLAERATKMARLLDGSGSYKFWDDPPMAYVAPEPANPNPPTEPPNEPPVQELVEDDKGDRTQKKVASVCDYSNSNSEEDTMPPFLACGACIAEYSAQRTGDDDVRGSHQQSTVSSKWLSMMYLVDQQCGFSDKMGEFYDIKMDEALLALEDYGHCREATYSWGGDELSDENRTAIHNWMRNGMPENDQNLFQGIYGASVDTLKAAMCGGGVDLEDAYDEIKSEYKSKGKWVKRGKKRVFIQGGRDEAGANQAVEQFKSSSLHKCLQEAKELLASNKKDQKKVKPDEIMILSSNSSSVGEARNWPDSQYACPFTGSRERYGKISDEFTKRLNMPQVLFNDNRECAVSTGVTEDGEPVYRGYSQVTLDRLDQITYPGAYCGELRYGFKNKDRKTAFNRWLRKRQRDQRREESRSGSSDR